MAIALNGSNQYLDGDAPVTAFPFTISIWLRPANTTTSQRILHLNDVGNNDLFFIACQGNVGGDPIRFSARDDGSNANADTTSGYVDSFWQHVVVSAVSATERYVRLDGANEGTNTTSKTPDDIVTLTLGMQPGGASYLAASIAELAIYDVALDLDTYGAALAAGFDPRLISPDDLVRYWQFADNTDLTDLIAGQTLTAHNAPTNDAHPTIITQAYLIYDNAGAGPVNYDSLVEAVAVGTETWTSGSLTYPATWRVGVRAANIYGEEKNTDVVQPLRLDDAGLDTNAVPNLVTGLQASANAGGTITLTWSYDTTDEGATATTFNIYTDSGTGIMDWDTPTDTEAKTSGQNTSYSWTSGALTDGLEYTWGVRAATATIENPQALTVSATADATAPVQPASLTASATR